MKNKVLNIALMALALIALVATSCNKGTSYAELITNENHAVNRFLADQRVEGAVPPDSVFEVGSKAPYYQLDEDGNIFMQVLNTGDMADRPQPDDLVYFRFMCSNLNQYTNADDMDWTGNAFNLDQVVATSFRFGNYTLESSYQWGTGLQMPLYYLGYNCEVNIIIKSQFGPRTNISSVQPYVYNVRYYRSQI